MSQQLETERAVLLRGHELPHLRCTLTSSPPSDSPPPSPPQPQLSDHHQTHSSLLNDLLSSIESSDYLRGLSFDADALVLRQISYDESSSSSSSSSVDRVYSELLCRVESFLVSEPEDDKDKAYRPLLVVSIVVATFLASTQCKMTGPLKEMAKCPLALKKVGGKGEDEELVEWENWARNQQMATNFFVFIIVYFFVFIFTIFLYIIAFYLLKLFMPKELECVLLI